MANWLDAMLGGKKNIEKEATIVEQGKDSQDHFEKKVASSGFLADLMDVDEEQVERDYKAKLSEEARLLGKTAAHEFKTEEEVVEADYHRQIKILSDSNLAEMLAEFRGQKENNFLEKSTELREKAKKEVASSREKAEKEVLGFVGMTSQVGDWQKTFEKWSKEAKVEQPTEKDLYEPKSPEKEHNFQKPSEDKFKSPTEEEIVPVGNGREADERTEVTKEPLPVNKEASLGTSAEYQPKTGEPCFCRPGVARDNCPSCEGTGMKIDFKKIHEKKSSKEAGAHQAWDVILNGKVIDTVFYDADCDADYVKRGLINHDGYDAGIEVRKPRKSRASKKDASLGKKASLLAKYYLDKTVTAYNEESGDWSGQIQDMGEIEKGTLDVESMEDAVKQLSDKFGLDFEPFGEEENEHLGIRFSVAQAENDEGMEDPKGKYLADYELYIKLYQEHAPTKGKESSLDTDAAPKLKVGDRVQISGGSGLSSDQLGVIVSSEEFMKEVGVNERGVPKIDGYYKPVDWTKEYAIRLDDGSVITMYKNRVNLVTDKVYDKHEGRTVEHPKKDATLNQKAENTELDKQIGALFVKLEDLRAKGLDKEKGGEFDSVLSQLRELNKKRMGDFKITPMKASLGKKVAHLYGIKSISAKVLANGNLQIMVDDTNELQEIKEAVASGDQSDASMYDAFESLVAIGYQWISPEDIGALTDAPILANGSLDDPRVKIWWYPDYQVKSPLEDIAETGKTIFTLAPEDKQASIKSLKLKKKADYQGWKNYETWAVALWADNDQGLQQSILEMVPQYKEAYELGDAIKELIEESKPDVGNTLWADLLNGALSEVDWREVAESYMQKSTESSKKVDISKEAASNSQVIDMFVNDSFPKDKMPTWGTDNLKISKQPNGWALVNYSTPLLYRQNGASDVYFNTQKYSPTTSKIQNYIKKALGGSANEVDEAGMTSAIDGGSQVEASISCPACGAEGQDSIACQACGIAYGSSNKMADPVNPKSLEQEKCMHCGEEDSKGNMEVNPRTMEWAHTQCGGVWGGDKPETIPMATASKKKVAETVKQQNDGSFICTCGNTSDAEGFYPCDASGVEVEPVDGKWDNLYGCAGCGRVIKQDTLEVVPDVKFKQNDIVSHASKQDVIKMIKTAEISSPWAVVTNEKGQEVIARVSDESTNTKVSEESADEISK